MSDEKQFREDFTETENPSTPETQKGETSKNSSKEIDAPVSSKDDLIELEASENEVTETENSVEEKEESITETEEKIEDESTLNNISEPLNQEDENEVEEKNEDENVSDAEEIASSEDEDESTLNNVSEPLMQEDENEVEEKNEDENVPDEEEITSSEDEEDAPENDTQIDYTTLSEKELIYELEKLIKSKPVQEIKNEVEEIRSEFHSKINEDEARKKEAFLAEGGNIIDFHYASPLKKEFNTLYFEFKDKHNNHFKNLKKDLQANLDNRWALIEELKGLLNAEENINTTSKHFKEIQEKWRGAGPIPRDKYNTVWNTYHHHVENFYDFLNLNREFRDLDFKHNLEEKLKIIERAEVLENEPDINKAFRELQMLHKMWKEDIGPVAKEHRDLVWDRFSELTKVIHDRRQLQLEELEKEFEANYDLKKQLISEIEILSSEPKPSHQAWQNAMKKVQELREIYFSAGSVPRAKNKEMWKAFKDASAAFNHEKNVFYKNHKKEQFSNLEKKQELIQIADENKDGEDFEAITPLMKKIQNDWKHIGHVPRKDSDRVWKQFKNACNHYFERVHAQKNEENKEEVANYEAKKQLLDSLSNFEMTGDHKTDLASIKQQINTWKELGKVAQSKRHIEQKFNKTLDGLFGKLDLGKKETELIKFENKLNSMVSQEDERKLQNEHFFISKKIDETRDEILQLENNLGFFQHVDSNNPLVREVHNNINRQKEQLEVWKAKLKKIKLVRED